MSQLDEIARMAKILTAIAQQGEWRALKASGGQETAIRKSVLEGLRWHIRGLFVAAYSEPSCASKAQDPNRARVTQKLDEELVTLGNVIKSATRRVGPLYFPSEPVNEALVGAKKESEETPKKRVK